MCSAKQAEKLLGRDGKPLTKSVEIRFPGQVETPLKAKVSEVNIDAENDIARSSSPARSSTAMCSG